jgi:hypothetical protein
MNEYEDYMEDIPEEYYGVALKEKMPKVVEEWKKAALTVSHKNDIPAMMAFFVTLGQIVKDFIKIPRGANAEDSRVHFCWIQTSGTGKSTLWNFLGPVNKSLNAKINEFEGVRAILVDAENNENYTANFYNIFDVVEYTDAALIGFYDKVINSQYDKNAEDNADNKEWNFNRMAGALEGNGLAHWDEFEYSGVFINKNQHKKNIIVYLNTLMNSLAGESWIITKKLKEGKVMECICKRSVFATTYPPKNLKSVIAEKGALQRMLCYVREVSEPEQHEMRMISLKQSGIREKVDLPIEKFANALFTLYKEVKGRFLEVGEDPFKTVEYSDGFADALINEYNKMRDYVATCRPEIREIAQNFMTRMNVILMKLAVLCCIANSPQIKDPTKKYIVTPTHVRQAYILTQQCYSTLVAWLERSLKVQRETLAEKSQQERFMQICEDLPKDENGFIRKKDLLEGIEEQGEVSQATAYRFWKNVEHKFEKDNIGRSILLRLKKTGDENK